MNIRKLSSRSAGFDAELDKLLAFEETADEKLEATVAGILADVRKRGDAAVLEYTQRFDRLKVSGATALEIPEIELRAAFDSLSAEQRSALEQAAQRITDFHRKQVQTSWSYTDADGTLLGQQVTPLDRVGLYVPGGKAAYPSSVLMNALPAKVAGVAELIMVVPTPDGVKNQLVLAAAYLAGVDRVFTIGGAQAVAALAYGTATIPKVDKVVGPGSALIHVADLDEACAISNRIAPDHLELSVADPQAWLPKLKHAGAIFMGRYTSEALGDYCAGPNHVLPTSGTARFSSPLGVYDFQKRSSLIQVSVQGAQKLGEIASVLAFGEGLQAHAQSALFRKSQVKVS